jgi:hypothetical protein
MQFERIPARAINYRLMTPSRYRPANYLDLMERVFDPSGEGMVPVLAERILEMDFPEADATRAEELNEKANDGTLTPEEESELEAFVAISGMLAFWQSKARQALRNAV